MRRFATAAVLSLGVFLAACSKPEYFDMQPTRVTFESKGATRTVRAVAKDRRGNEYPTSKPTEWTSSDEKVATVDESGKVTAVGSGVATITARLGKMSGESMVDVVVAERLQVEPTEIRVEQDGKPFRPEIKLLDARGKALEGRLIRVKCADEKVCTTDGDKQVWPHDPGETIYEISHEGLKKRVKVVVEPAKRR